MVDLRAEQRAYFPIPTQEQVYRLYEGRTAGEPLPKILRSYIFDSTFRKAYRDCEGIPNLMVLGNQGLVFSVANRYTPVGRRHGLETDDLVTFGIDGLYRAIDKYDHKRGYTFATYGTWWIRSSISAGIINEGSGFTLTDGIIGRFGVLDRTVDALRNELGSEPAQSLVKTGLSKNLGSESFAGSTLNAQASGVRSVLPLSTPIGEDLTFADLPRTDDTAPQEAEAGELRVKIAEALKGLSERHRLIIIRRFGLDNGAPTSQQDVAKELGISYQRVSRLEHLALIQLRRQRVSMEYAKEKAELKYGH
jgi:RNA polymerase sigma factor (sigma-70 family)